MLRGYRGWKLHIVSGEPVLVSPSHLGRANANDLNKAFTWIAGENASVCAICGAGIGEKCTCGIYSLKEPTGDLVNFKPDIIGEVLLWGKIIEYDSGYRSKKAMISMFFLPSVECIPEVALTKLSNKYNAPLVKAEGEFLARISKERRDRLIARGQLPFVAQMLQYKEDWSYIGRAPRRSGQNL